MNRLDLCFGHRYVDRIKVFVEYLYFPLIFVSINECVRDSYRLHFAFYAHCFSNPVEIEGVNRVDCDADVL